MTIPWTEVTLRLFLAAVFGSIIGLERERKEWAAGLRTHMMVCVGSTLTMIVSAHGFGDVLGKPDIVLDPSRMAAQVISGIGFIGAGTILFLRQGIIRGLTTASGLWTVAAIGLATGGGMYFAAVTTTLLALVILYLLQPLEQKLAVRFRHKNLKIVTTDKETSLRVVGEVYEIEKTQVQGFSVDKNEEDYVISIRFRQLNQPELLRLIQTLQSHPSVKEVVWNG